jgi:hypothetical protein
MVIEHKASLAFSGLALKNQGGRKATDAAAYDDTVVGFSGISEIRRLGFELPVTNAVSRFQYCVCIPITVCVVTHSAVASPVIRDRLVFSSLLCQQLGR